MLIEPSESDDSVSIFNEDDAVLINRDHQIQTGWNTIEYDVLDSNVDSGILIVPSFHTENRHQDGLAASTTTENMASKISVENLSIPSSIPTSVPTFLPDGNLSISGIFNVNGDISDEPYSIVGTDEKCPSRKHRSIYLLGNSRRVLVFVSLVSASILYLISMRLSWNETTTKLEKTIRELQQVEQRTAKIHQEQSNFLNELLSQLQNEEKARQLEKEKAEALKLEVLRLQQEIESIDKEGKRAKDLEETVVQLRRDAEARAVEIERAAHLEQEVKQLQTEKNKKSRCGSSESRRTGISWENQDESSTRLLDNCWVQSDVKMELGDCARRTRETVSQQLRDWGDSLLNAQERIQMRMAQDYNDLKEMFQAQEEAVEEEAVEDVDGNTENDEAEHVNNDKNEKADRFQSISRMWRDVSDTLSNAQVRVTEQMAHDYNDVMEFFNDLSFGGMSQDESKIHTEEQQKTKSDQGIKENPLKPNEKLKTEETEKIEKKENDDQEPGIGKRSVKSILYGVAYASIASVAVDYAGSWLSAIKGSKDYEE